MVNNIIPRGEQGTGDEPKARPGNEVICEAARGRYSSRLERTGRRKSSKTLAHLCWASLLLIPLSRNSAFVAFTRDTAAEAQIQQNPEPRPQNPEVNRTNRQT